MILDTLSELWIWQLIGRIHPLIVHFPIGALVIAFFLEALTLGGKRSELRAGIRWLVYIGAGTSLLAAIVGFMLAYDGNYSESTIFIHRWGGILTVILALLSARLIHRSSVSGKKKDLNIYRGTLAATVIVLTFVGHFGANLTHGSDYITSVLPWNYETVTEGEFDELLTEVNQHMEMGTVSETHKNELNVGVRRIFANSCYRCHDSNKSEGNLALNSKEAVMEGGDGGAIIIPNDPNNSELVRRITLPEGHDDVMPQKGSSLTSGQVELIRTWIEVGAPWSDEEVETFREAEIALFKPNLPPETGTDFKNPIDRFTDVYFEENDVEWPEPIDDVTFMRRVYMDVIGLIPEPEDIETFVNDTSPDKREKLIDQLLNRKHDYTQHWLTFWNDLLRNDYTGTGFITGGREQITDWLYNSLYNNKPYNTIVQELTNPNEKSDGFIRGIEWRGAVNSSQTTEMQAAQNISQSLLGLNLKCASCHDSFVSNLTLKDAYSFAAIFSESPLEMKRCEISTGDTAKAGFVYSQELGEIDENLPKEERLEQLADLLSQKQNGRLYRTIVNRYWELLMGRGLIEPVDAMDNLPWSQDLLDWLASDLIEHDYDLKHLISTILRSRTYQLPSVGISKEQAGSEDYVFKGPMRKRMTAEQFADAVSQVAAPFYYSAAYNPYDFQLADADWIWYNSRDNGEPIQPSPGKYYFRHNFNLSSEDVIKKAQLLITADEAYTLYLNGLKIGEGEDWRQVKRINVSEHLKAGNNLLAIEAINKGTDRNTAGILLNLKVSFSDGSKSLEVKSNEQWKATSKQVSSGWETPAFDNRGWGSVRSLGSSVDNKEWGQLLEFSHQKQKNQLNFVRASLVPNDGFLKQMGRPTRENIITNREAEATLLQALELANGNKLNEVIARGADNWLNKYEQSPNEMIKQLYFTALSRAPSSSETQIAENLLTSSPSKQAVQDLLWAIAMNPEFQIIN